MKKNFELFICCLGYGLTVCNKAVEENHDYKKIAHISPRGHINLSVPQSYIPAADWDRIKAIAAAEREKFLAEFNKLPELKRYSIILDELPLSEMLEYIHKDIPLNEKVAELTDLYLAL